MVQGARHDNRKRVVNECGFARARDPGDTDELTCGDAQFNRLQVVATATRQREPRLLFV